MRKRFWEKGNKELPVLGFGGAALSGEGGGYGFGDITEAEAIKLVQMAYEAGFRLFDTAPIYGFGLSEIRLGKALKSIRENVTIVSKSGVTWHETKRVNMTNDPLVVEKMLHQSLKDLNTDYIDLYMIHWPDPKVDIRRPLEIYKKAQDQGKIKQIGLCNTTLEDLEKAKEIADISMVQSELNIFNTNPVRDLFPYLKKNKIGFMSWGTLDRGILTGRVTRDRKFDASDSRSWAPWWKGQDFEAKFNWIEKVEPVLKEHKLSLLELALGHNLHYSEVNMLLVGIKNEKSLHSMMEALENVQHKQEAIEEVLKNFSPATEA
jgi:myo-inositol catabolism protein IolS